MSLLVPRGLAFAGFALALAAPLQPADPPRSTPPVMHWADASRGRPFAKDPSVVRFQDRYLMYYSIPPFGDKRPDDGWAIRACSSIATGAPFCSTRATGTTAARGISRGSKSSGRRAGPS